MPASLQKIKTNSVKPNSKALSRNVDTCKKLINQYGMIAPPVIGDFDDGTKALLFGGCVFEAAIELKTDYTESMIVPLKNQAEGDKLSLMLMDMRASADALSEGMLINNLIGSGLHNQTDIAGLLSRSVSWVNKRLSLVTRLEPAVRGMVSQGRLSPQTAQEIARMPPEVQHDFSSKIINGKIPKSAVEKLVSEYGRPDCPDELKSLIIDDPAKAIGIMPEKPATQMGNKSRADFSGEYDGKELEATIIFLNDSIARATKVIYQATPALLNKNESAIKQSLDGATALIKIIGSRLGEISFPQGKNLENRDFLEDKPASKDFLEEKIKIYDFPEDNMKTCDFPEEKPIKFTKG